MCRGTQTAISTVSHFTFLDLHFRLKIAQQITSLELSMVHSSSDQTIKHSLEMSLFRLVCFFAASIFSVQWNPVQGMGQVLHPIEGRQHFLRSRRLGAIYEFDVQLFLNLQFIDQTTATKLETRDRENPAISHFCEAVKQQVCSTTKSI